MRLKKLISLVIVIFIMSFNYVCVHAEGLRDVEYIFEDKIPIKLIEHNGSKNVPIGTKFNLNVSCLSGMEDYSVELEYGKDNYLSLPQNIYGHCGKYECDLTLSYNGNDEGVICDKEKYHVVVDICKDHTTYKSYKIGNNYKTDIVFEIDYPKEAETEIVDEVIVEFDGDVGEKEIFEVVIQPADENTPLPPVVSGESRISEDGSLVYRVSANKPKKIGGVIFKQVGTYEYLVFEANGLLSGVVYDTRQYKIIVDVTYNEDKTGFNVKKRIDYMGVPHSAVALHFINKSKGRINKNNLKRSLGWKVKSKDAEDMIRANYDLIDDTYFGEAPVPYQKEMVHGVYKPNMHLRKDMKETFWLIILGISVITSISIYKRFFA